MFKNITKTEGGTEDLVKIIKTDSIGNIEWDSANSNNWTTASLQTSLNTTYYNGTKLSKSEGIKDSTRPMIEQVTWNIGGRDTLDSTAVQYYTAERGEKTYQNSRPTIWNGYIGLMYASDYGYATGGSGLSEDSTTNREGCLNMNLNKWGSGDYVTNCAHNDWLFSGFTYESTLTPDSSYSGLVFGIMSAGSVVSSFMLSSTMLSNPTRPSLYLKFDVQIANGKGTSIEPYVLKI